MVDQMIHRLIASYPIFNLLWLFTTHTKEIVSKSFSATGITSQLSSPCSQITVNLVIQILPQKRIKNYHANIITYHNEVVTSNNPYL